MEVANAGGSLQQETLSKIMGDVDAIDWSCGQAAHTAGAGLLDRVLSEPGLLRSAVADVVNGRVPKHDCESFEGLDKLVLWQSPDRAIRLRLHVFPPGYAGRPHHHRWSFVSRVVFGQYVHAPYGADSTVLDAVAGGATPRVVHQQRVVAGSDYFIDRSMVHSIRADETAISLMLRGPSLTDDYFTVVDPGSRDVRWNKGAAQEDAALRSEKVMKPADFARVFSRLEASGVI
jgi:hypothetical protein